MSEVSPSNLTTYGQYFGAFALGAVMGAWKLFRKKERKTRISEAEPNLVLSGLPAPSDVRIQMLKGYFDAQQFSQVRHFAARLLGDVEFVGQVTDLDRARLRIWYAVALMRTSGQGSSTSAEDLDAASAQLSAAIYPDMPVRLLASTLCNRAGLQVMQRNVGEARRLVRQAEVHDPDSEAVRYCALCIASLERDEAACQAELVRLLKAYPGYADGRVLAADPDLEFARQLKCFSLLVKPQSAAAGPHPLPLALGATAAIAVTMLTAINSAIATSSTVSSMITMLVAWGTSGAMR